MYAKCGFNCKNSVSTGVPSNKTIFPDQPSPVLAKCISGLVTSALKDLECFSKQPDKLKYVKFRLLKQTFLGLYFSGS